MHFEEQVVVTQELFIISAVGDRDQMVISEALLVNPNEVILRRWSCQLSYFFIYIYACD